MQIGGRWPFGATPPRGLPADFIDALTTAEAEAPPEQRSGSWTLTWLEGRPVAELDGGLRIGGDVDHHAVLGADDDDDDDLFPED